ncbi:Uncharacterised protein [Mycobacterium tuberculosis]|nr:Uncharacterised protein [Mycobacterium tuberculosis]COW56124.1 Uncharacterised protein [Mycobacterium tuberculosis]COW77768.1 Uncharacterised protein [Mycobacterium tuberculosis]
MWGRNSRIHSAHSTQSWVSFATASSPSVPSSVVISGTRSRDRSGRS